ncbi:MAG: amidase family protein [Actinomycetota bacterium]|nr:amidase family protein [Actinomycetota bacterium]
MPVDPHPPSAAIAALGAGALSDALGRGELRSVEVVDALIGRIHALDAPETPTALRAVLEVSERALAEAASSDTRRAHGAALGPLDGVPVLVKDNIEVEGLASCAGATALVDRPVPADASLVSSLRDAGLVVLGATNLSEWANIRSEHSTSGWSALGGLCGNPWSLGRSAGGSSSGAAAAVAAGFAPLAIGTETDGSIVCPSSLCGVAGLKPAVGSVSRTGVVPISASQDSPGPIARSAADVALLLGALFGASLERADASELRLGVARTWMTGHGATDAAFEQAITALAHELGSLADREPPSPGEQEHEDELTVMLCELSDGIDAYLARRGGEGPASFAQVVEFQAAHADVELAHFGQDLFERALSLGGRGGTAYGPARERNLAWARSACLEPTFEGLDVLLAPAWGPAWKSDLVLGDPGSPASPACRPAAIAGWPIATVPIALVEGLPVGVALVARPGGEAALVALAAAMERAVGLLEDGSLSPAWAPPARG